MVDRHRTQESRAREAIDRLVADFFSAFDNRSGPPRMEDILACFADKAVIVRCVDSKVDFYTVMEFALPRIELLTRGALVDFHEAETSSTTQVFGAMATRNSRYSKAGLLDGEHHGGSGTKCFQLVELDTGWRIASLAWVDDDAPPPT